MSILLADSFMYLGRKPLDSRFTCDTLKDMVDMPESVLYDGIIVYVKEKDSYYKFNSINNTDPVLGKWEDFKSGGDGNAFITEYTQNYGYKKNDLVLFNNSLYVSVTDFKSDNTETDIENSIKKDIENNNLFPVSYEKSKTTLEYVQNETYEKDALVYLGDKIARVETDFTSDNTLGFTVKESFEDDVKNKKINIINTDHVDIMNKYSQSNMYLENTLVYHGDLITRVQHNFVADSTPGNTVDDSFEEDVKNNNLLVLNKEVEHMIKPYKQNSLFEKNKIVYAEEKIARVLNDFVSDNTPGNTTEQSLMKDVYDGKLVLMGESYPFIIHKTTKDMNKTIDSINVLKDTDLVLENGLQFKDLNVNEAVYGPLGTLALIKEVDLNNREIKAKTINSREMEFMPPAPVMYKCTVVLPGTGYSAGDIIPTNTNGIFVSVDSVASDGSILSVSYAEDTSVNTSGVGASVTAEMIYYVGNGKIWFELPQNKKNAVIKHYKQGEEYETDNLICIDDILAIALTNFTSDSSLPTVEDSFKYDITTGNITRLTREDVDIPECLGSVKTDNTSDLPVLAVKGNWILIENCVNEAPDHAGIGLYDGTSWNVSPIPQGTFTFPEPPDDGKLYFRKRESGVQDGQWEAFTKVDGNTITINIKSKDSNTDSSYIPAKNELLWDSYRKILVIGDGVSTLGDLKAFYEGTITYTDIISALGYTPADISEKGMANGYAPLDSSGKVPAANLPSALTDTYSKSEIESKDNNILNSATTLVNAEAAAARSAENGLRTDIDAHISDNSKHVTQTEKDSWTAKVDPSDLTKYDNHLTDSEIHVTQDDKDKWNGMNKAYFVTSASSLPSTGNTIGNIGYVQVSSPGTVPIVCDKYIWDGISWKQLDEGKVSLQFSWGNLSGKPSSTPLAIDNAVTISHSHTNKSVLDKIGQSAAGNFTYNGIEIGVKVVFLDNENMLSSVGEEDTLYVIYEDSRVRKYPSISVWRNGSYQILGRGTQDVAPAVGDMSILQSEYFSVVKNSKYVINVTPNQFFAFMPVEILKEIEGLKNETKELADFSSPSDYLYNEDLLNISSDKKLTVSLADKPTSLNTVSDFYYSEVDIDLSDYKDIDSIS